MGWLLAGGHQGDDDGDHDSEQAYSGQASSTSVHTPPYGIREAVRHLGSLSIECMESVVHMDRCYFKPDCQAAVTHADGIMEPYLTHHSCH